MENPYRLRCTLSGHSMDVRVVATADFLDDVIITGSRDRTTRIWHPSTDEPSYSESQCLTGPTNFISSICVLPATEQYPLGLVIVGSNDCSIYAFSVDSSQPKYKLLGHSGNVCALASGKFGTVVSGSWDKTARVWLGQKCMMTLEGHSAAVWAVQILPEQGLTLTGSADKTIRMWRAGKCEKVFSGHEDCVRGLVSISPLEFLSCSNDATVRQWRISGECLHVYQGHTNFVYDVAVIQDCQEFVTCSEDRTLRVWTIGEDCSQVIRTPAQSLWSVACIQNGDIVVGSSDGLARVFSRQANRQAPPDELAAFEEETAKTALPAGELGDLKISELPGKEALYEPGRRDGQTKIIRDGSEVSCHQWSSNEGRWIKVGDVVGASGATQATSGKTLFEGEEYDYVFTVDLDGEGTLKLPYNINEDPWFAAQKFIHKHDLSQYYLDQVANFIINNTKGITLGQVSTGIGSDPLTGNSRYIPQSSQGSLNNNGNDPFTGGSRYIPQPVVNTNNVQSPVKEVSGSTVNPFFPQLLYLKFQASNLEGLSSKLREFNLQMDPEHRLLDSDLQQLLDLAKTEQLPSQSQIAILHKAMGWPESMVFPVLDVVRLAVIHPESSSQICRLWGPQLMPNLLRFLHSPSSSPNQMLSLRILSNMFEHTSELMISEQERILSSAMNCASSTNKNTQIALSTLLLNYSVSLNSRSSNIESKSQCLSGVMTMLQKTSDSEAVFRLLVSLGTTMWGDPESIAFARTLDLLPILERLSKTKDPAKVGECAIYLATLLK